MQHSTLSLNYSGIFQIFSLFVSFLQHINIFLHEKANIYLLLRKYQLIDILHKHQIQICGFCEFVQIVSFVNIFKMLIKFFMLHILLHRELMIYENIFMKIGKKGEREERRKNMLIQP